MIPRQLAQTDFQDGLNLAIAGPGIREAEGVTWWVQRWAGAYARKFLSNSSDTRAGSWVLQLMK